MIKAVKGMNDLYGKRAFRWAKMEDDIKMLISNGNFTEIRTPVVEDYALFKRSVGETTDVVQKEMYDFRDKKDRHIALRPEGTAGVVRSFVEHRMDIDNILPLKLFYIGPFFRYERPQKGRYRQFHQLGIEILGDDTPQSDAEMIYTAFRLIKHFKIEQKVSINSIGCKECRPIYREKLIEYFSSRKSDLCEDCTNRLETNPLRLLDCKTCKPKERYTDIPVMTDYLCDECADHFSQLKKSLDVFHVPFEVDPFIVRGLDYYTRTAFEILADTGGSQNAVAGGGRYDNLISDIGGPQTPATGFAMGLERLFDMIPEDFYIEPVLCSGFALTTEGVDDLVHFTKHMSHHPVVFAADYKPKKMKKALQKASKMESGYTFIFGEDEVREKKVLMKNMETGEQKIYGQHEVMIIVQEILKLESQKILKKS